MNICILSTPRSGTEYFKRMLSETCSMPNAISDPFIPDKIFKINSNYIIGAKQQLEIIKNLELTNSLLIKENHFFLDFKYQMQIWINEIGIDLSENIELIKIFEQYTTLLKNNFYIIKLIRNNVFETALSLYIADHTEIWHQFKDDPLTTVDKIFVDVDYFHYLLIRCIKMKKSLIDYNDFKESVFYEDLSGDYSIDRKLLKGIPFCSVTNNYQRILKKNVDKKDIVKNYEEVLKIYEGEMLNAY